ncbi:STAS domain-containing protein [Streptomyces sp. NPDC057565]|uniref:STAS domain-containing protein n=1 Tax=Streptomyces sp. NPDC057565 TaxID=3346169 RepID=UPI0036BE1885
MELITFHGAGLSVAYEHVSASVTVVKPMGEIGGSYQASFMRGVFVDLINQGHCLLAVDLEGIDLLDSTGIGTLVGALYRVRKPVPRGMIALSQGPERVMKMFRTLGFTKIFPIHPTIQEAEEWLLREEPNYAHRRAVPESAPHLRAPGTVRRAS